MSLLPDDDAIIPILDDEYFKDDIVNRTKEFLSKAFSPDTLTENIKFIEDALGKDLRKFYAKDFYADHIKRYKKRPIYWMFASPKGTFRALIYMHRYKSDTLSQMLSNYLRPLIEALKGEQTLQNRTNMSDNAAPADTARAQKRLDKIIPQIEELEEYEQVLYRLAAKRIEIDLDDGVRVNYPKFAPAIVPIKGLESEEE